MRRGAFLFWIVIILLVAVYGWKVLGAIAAVFLVLFLLLAAMVAGILVIRARMQKRMREMAAAVAEARARMEEQQRSEAVKRDAIDVEPLERDGNT